MRTRPDLASMLMIVCFIATFFKIRDQWAGSKVLAHLYKKYRVPLQTKKYSVMVFDAKFEALISQNIAHNLVAKVMAIIDKYK